MIALLSTRITESSLEVMELHYSQRIRTGLLAGQAGHTATIHADDHRLLSCGL